MIKDKIGKELICVSVPQGDFSASLYSGMSGIKVKNIIADLIQIELSDGRSAFLSEEEFKASFRFIDEVCLSDYVDEITVDLHEVIKLAEIKGNDNYTDQLVKIRDLLSNLSGEIRDDLMDELDA